MLSTWIDIFWDFFFAFNKYLQSTVTVDKIQPTLRMHMIIRFPYGTNNPPALV